MSVGFVESVLSRRWLGWSVPLAACVVLPFTLAPVPGRPEVVPARAMEANVQAPAPVRALLHRSCGNCHSVHTEWPWYSRLPGVASLVQRDVERGRKAMNLSVWPERPAIGASLLMAMCTDVERERMPPAPYLALHREARVSPAERQQLCSWTRSEVKRLLLAQRARRRP